MRTTRKTKVVVALTLVAAVALAACGSKAANQGKATSTTQSSPSTTHGSTTTTAAATTTVAPTTTTTVPAFPYLYVYPFTSLAQAQAWQRAYAAGGHQPWHLDAGMTASSFADFIGGAGQFDRVINVREDASGAHVALGYHNPNGVPETAGIVHLVRIASGNDRPWEVVGDEQSADFTLTVPAYAATVSSPVRVAGRITGVDESIRVQVWPLSRNGTIGERCCLPAGGERAPWSTTVTFSRTADPVLIITAKTGGHLQAVERFVFTAVRAR